jgi:hypothetical protein
MNTLQQAIHTHYANERELTTNTMHRIAQDMGLTNPELAHDLHEIVSQHTNDWPENEGFGTSDYNAIYRAYEIHYLNGLQPGETVIETAYCLYKNVIGTIYTGQGEYSKGKNCVKWSDGMGTSVTHGTRRPKDIGVLLGWYSEKQSQLGGTLFYNIYQQGAIEVAVEVTCVTDNENDIPKWDDLRYVGPVTTLNHQGRHATVKQFQKQDIKLD